MRDRPRAGPHDDPPATGRGATVVLALWLCVLLPPLLIGWALVLARDAWLALWKGRS